MKTLGGTGARSDGDVRYRQDVRSGGRIGILPATCKRGVHSLAAVGYDATETDGVLREVYGVRGDTETRPLVDPDDNPTTSRRRRAR